MVLAKLNCTIAMSIMCTDIEDSDLTGKASYKFTNKFVHVSSTLPPECTQIDRNYHFRKIFLPAEYKAIANDLLNFEVREDDVWVITYPKSGTTLMCNIVWLLKNNLDFQTDTAVRLNARAPYLESRLIFNDAHDQRPGPLVNVMRGKIDIVNAAESPRVIKSHLHVNLLPRQIWTVKPKIVYVARDPRDVAVSCYHHYRNVQGYVGDFDDFMDAFLAEHIMYAPIQDHVQNFLQLRNEKNFFFTSYEEIQSNRFEVIRNVMKFLEASYSDEQLMRLCEHVSFEKMKSNSGANWEGDIALMEESFRFQRPDKGFR